MSTFHEPFEAVLSTAMERIKDLKRSNQQLIKSLEAATSRAASYKAQLEKVLDLERENQRLAGELETMLSLLTSLKGVMKVALQGIRQEDVQELRKKLEVVYKIISLYELLHGSDQGGDTEVPTLKADVQAPATHQRPERGARGPHRGTLSRATRLKSSCSVMKMPLSRRLCSEGNRRILVRSLSVWVPSRRPWSPSLPEGPKGGPRKSLSTSQSPIQPRRRAPSWPA